MFRLLWCFKSGSPVAQSVLQQIPKKKEIVPQVPAGEAAGFGGKAEYPSQAQALQPYRRVGFHAGVYVESEAHGQNHSTPDELLVALDPGLLLGRAKADPNEVRREPIDLRNHLLLCGAFQDAVGLTLSMK